MKPIIYVFTLLLLVACAPKSNNPALSNASSATEAIGEMEGNMKTLEVHLQEGFKGDTVLLQVEDQDPVQQANVTTKLLYGYAAVITVRVPEGKIQLRVTLPERQLSDTVELQIPDERFVGVSLIEGKIEVVKSHEVFGYM